MTRSLVEPIQRQQAPPWHDQPFQKWQPNSPLTTLPDFPLRNFVGQTMLCRAVASRPSCGKYSYSAAPAGYCGATHGPAGAGYRSSESSHAANRGRLQNITSYQILWFFLILKKATDIHLLWSTPFACITPSPSGLFCLCLPGPVLCVRKLTKTLKVLTDWGGTAELPPSHVTPDTASPAALPDFKSQRFLFGLIYLRFCLICCDNSCTLSFII